MPPKGFYTAFHKALNELGLITLWSSTSDAKLLCAQRFVRLFAYGSSTLILVSFLSALEVSKAKIGLFMTLTMIGDTVLSFLFTYFADLLGRKSILIMGSILMTVAGAIFALSGNYWVLLSAAVIGVISPNGTECGPFRAIEESTLAQLTQEEDRGDIYAWYSLLGGMGSAFGLGLCGWLLHILDGLGWRKMRAYKAVFWGYSALGIVMLCIVLFLSKACEIEREQLVVESSSSSVIDIEGIAVEENKTSITFKLPKFSKESRIIVIKLCILCAIDSFGCSLAPLSWITFFFHDKFSLSDNKLGTIFFATSFIAALSMLPASSVAKRLGNVKTMVIAHLPGAILLALIPIPNSVSPAVALLILRSSTQSMDTAPRSAFMAGVVASQERTPMMGFVFIARSSAGSLSPMITGILAGKGLLWVAFIVAGALMCVYDVGIWILFGRLQSMVRGIEGSGRGQDEESNISSKSEEVITTARSASVEQEEGTVQRIIGGEEKPRPAVLVEEEEMDKGKAQNKIEAS